MGLAMEAAVGSEVMGSLDLLLRESFAAIDDLCRCGRAAHSFVAQ